MQLFSMCHRPVTHCRTSCALLAERSPGNLLSSLAVATDDLDSIRLNGDRVLHLESHILNQEGPHLITEAVSVEVALIEPSC